MNSRIAMGSTLSVLAVTSGFWLPRDPMVIVPVALLVGMAGGSLLFLGITEWWEGR